MIHKIVTPLGRAHCGYPRRPSRHWRTLGDTLFQYNQYNVDNITFLRHFCAILYIKFPKEMGNIVKNSIFFYSVYFLNAGTFYVSKNLKPLAAGSGLIPKHNCMSISEA